MQSSLNLPPSAPHMRKCADCGRYTAVYHFLGSAVCPSCRRIREAFLDEIYRQWDRQDETAALSATNRSNEH